MNNQKNIVTGIVAVITVIILGAVYYFFGPPSNDRTVVTNTTETITKVHKPCPNSNDQNDGDNKVLHNDMLIND